MLPDDSVLGVFQKIPVASHYRPTRRPSAAASSWNGFKARGEVRFMRARLEALPRIEDRNFMKLLKEALKATGYNIAHYDENNFAAFGDTGRFVQLTDRKSWRCRVASITPSNWRRDLSDAVDKPLSERD
jgi:hypothetical protein